MHSHYASLLDGPLRKKQNNEVEHQIEHSNSSAQPLPINAVARLPGTPYLELRDAGQPSCNHGSHIKQPVHEGNGVACPKEQATAGWGKDVYPFDQHSSLGKYHGEAIASVENELFLAAVSFVAAQSLLNDAYLDERLEITYPHVP